MIQETGPSLTPVKINRSQRMSHDETALMVHEPITMNPKLVG